MKIRKNNKLFYFSVRKGIDITNEFEESRFEQYLRRILSKTKTQDTEIFTDDERNKLEKIFKIDKESLSISIKTVVYIFKRLLKFIFMPLDLKNDLNILGFNNEKSDLILKVWSAETRTVLQELGSEFTNNSRDMLNFSWKLNAELSSECCKKSKIPKAYLLITDVNNSTEIEFEHSELHSMYIQFEAVQVELDNLMI